MPDFDLERLESAFSQLRTSTTGHVRPPGLAAARATLRRRKRNRIAAFSVAAVLALGLPLMLHERGRSPVITPRPAPSMTTSPSPAASPSASSSPSPSPSSTGGAIGPAAPKFTYGARWITSRYESGNNVELPLAQDFAVPYGVDVRGGTVHNLKLVIDVSAIVGKVTVVSPGTGCVLSGPKITCDYGDVSAGLHMNGRLTLRAKAGAAPGRVGTVKMTTTATERSSPAYPIDGVVSISTTDEAADIAVKSWSVGSVRLGGTTTTTVTVTNKGPATAHLQQFATADGITPLSASGCTLVDNAPSGWDCNHDIAPGTTTTVKVTYTVTACTQNGDFAPFSNYSYSPVDPLQADLTDPPRLRVTGC